MGGNPKCTNHGDNVCESCVSGYRLSGNNCVANVCKCNSNIGWPVAPGDAKCTQHNSHVCKGCKAGYSLSGSDCVANKCECTGGTPVPRGDSRCKKNGAQVCQSCRSSYNSDGAGRCVKKPTKPGCYEFHTNGCRRNGKDRSDGWLRDTWGEQNRNAYNDQSACLARAKSIDDWCPTTGTQMVWNAPPKPTCPKWKKYKKKQK